ncbi:MAG: hypothetical protein H8D23_11495 [Candidatus Brocadiales bacterium]|nr:hypothetical protein [Candidatus Brocadiales bacterium]
MEQNKSSITDVFSRLKEDFESNRFSWVGDYCDFALGYISFASILHADSTGIANPVGQFVIGKTSTGKTEFLQALCRLLPPDRVINLTTASAKSLIYHCRQNPRYLNGKVVFVEELAGIRNEEIQYLLRVLVSKGYAQHTTVLSGAAETIEIIGKIALQSTGLDGDVLRDDTMNRLIIVETDESEEKTKKVLGHIIGRYSGKSLVGPDHFSEYREFFRGLKSYSVEIPYGHEIEFDSSEFISRRGAKIFMDLLSTVALINQAKRKIEGGRLVSKREDLELLLELTRTQERDVQDKQLGLSRSQEVIWDAIQRVPNRERFTYQQVVQTGAKGLDGPNYEISTIKRAIKVFLEANLVEAVKGSRPCYFAVLSKQRGNRFGVKEKNVLN